MLAVIGEVQQQPHLETRVRQSDADAMALGLAQGIVKVGELVDVQDAPRLVVLVGGCRKELHRVRDDLGRSLGMLDDLDGYRRVPGSVLEPLHVRVLGHFGAAYDQ